MAALVVAFFSTSRGVCADVAPSGGEFFERRIRPVLVEHCYECHSAATKTKGGLRLDSRADLLRGGDSGPAMVVGQPDESRIIAAVRHRDPDLAMPAKKPQLPAAVIADLAQWIRTGAEWPGSVVTAPASGIDRFNLAARKERLPWIWQTPQRQAVPSTAGVPASTEVDRFLRAKLAEKGLTPASPTDDRTWLRRVYFALTGLPPTREAMHSFAADTSPERRERVVDALLASPHFGERWARHWMDLVRYAESRGHESDFPIANAWRYRDYLVRAFNADLPYDRFVAEHVAGDLLPPRLHPATGANESVLATGWAFLGEENHSPVDIRQDECERVDNKVDVFSKTFLGLTVACARCHDHKFDAISQRDYYALSGFVLGSSFRQVRYETMEQHARAAKELADLRARQTVPVVRAFAAAVTPALASMSDYLVAAQRTLRGETAEAVAGSLGLDPVRLTAWTGHLRQAAGVSAHPLHWVATLALETNSAAATRRLDEVARAVAVPFSLPASNRVVADFRVPGQTPWKVDGPVFGSRPLALGEVVLGTNRNGVGPLAAVMGYGAARRDEFWNRLALTPGTESDAGSLEATARAGRMVRTPTITLQSGRLHYLLRGKARVYAAVDSHIMVAGPLHGGLVSGFDSGAQVGWVSQDLSAYSGHRVHLEFAPDGSNPLEILLVVESPEKPTALPVMAWQPTGQPGSFAAVAAQWQADVSAAAQKLGAENLGADARSAALADWLVQNHGWLGADETALAAAAATWTRDQQALAQSLRWDSHTAVSWFDGTGVDENVLLRGKPFRPGELAPRGLPAALGTPVIHRPDSSGRAELAQQLMDPANPLVARVMVNRVWQHLFGRGIVATPDNFGFLGERPTHPELLDHLAWQFVHQDRWSLKQLIKRLVLTDTFAMSSQSTNARAAEVDPANVWWHRMPVQRLEGEAIRDALLVVSGRFDPTPAEAPILVHLNEFIVGRGRPDKGGPLDGEGRRSLYTAIRRNFLPTMMVVFDYPTPFSTVGRRNVTNVPGQALALMNDPFVHQQSGVWAERLLRELPTAGDAPRVAWLFETAYARPPSAAESRACLDSLGELRTLHTGEAEVAVWSDFCHALVNANEFIYLN